VNLAGEPKESRSQSLTALCVGPDPGRLGPPAHILTPSVTSRGAINMTALAAVEAQEKARATTG
jgi:malate dehydrogenase (oxaloacetate-decarboxylating)(NADP+)